MALSVYAQDYSVKKPLKDKNGPQWILVRTISGSWGCIDTDGKEVVKPVYEKIGKFGKYRSNWALVKTISDTYGFIDDTGREIVPALYTKICMFGTPEQNLALVRSVSDTWGLIGTDGKEAVKPVYEKEHLLLNYKSLMQKDTQ